MDEFTELDSMKRIAEALHDLDDEARKRVINWTIDKYSIVTKKVAESTIESAPSPNDARIEEEEVFETVADLYYSIRPKTDADKALTIGYWFQEHRELPDFDSQSVNNELKHLGEKIGNITRAFNQLNRKKPALAMQVRKSGSSKQARKKYKLTHAGLKYIQERLSYKEEK